MHKVMKKTIIGLALVGALGCGTAQAGWGLGLKASTLGAGVDLTAGLSDSVNFRFSVNGASNTTNTTEGGIDYQGDMSWQSFLAIVDWHPFEGGFRVSAGYMMNNNKFTLTATPQGGLLTIGNNTYLVGGGNLIGKVTFSNGPYLGIGWGNAADGKGFGFAADLGVAGQGKPKVDFTTTISGVTAADLATEKAQAEDSLKSFQYYPVVALGIRYGF